MSSIVFPLWVYYMLRSFRFEMRYASNWQLLFFFSLSSLLLIFLHSFFYMATFANFSTITDGLVAGIFARNTAQFYEFAMNNECTVPCAAVPSQPTSHVLRINKTKCLYFRRMRSPWRCTIEPTLLKPNSVSLSGFSFLFLFFTKLTKWAWAETLKEKYKFEARTDTNRFPWK